MLYVAVMITQPGCTVNLCQLDWAKSTQLFDSWIFCISMKVFLDVGNCGPLYLTAWIRKEGNFLSWPDGLGAGTWVLLSSELRSYWSLYHQLSLVLRSLDSDWNYTISISAAQSLDFSRTIPLAFVKFPLAYRSQHFPALIIMWANSLYCVCVSVCVKYMAFGKHRLG